MKCVACGTEDNFESTLDGDGLSCRSCGKRQPGRMVATTDNTPATEAQCAYCVEKETGIAHPAHVGRCGMPTGRLGVVSCYCTKRTDKTPAAGAPEAAGGPLEVERLARALFYDYMRTAEYRWEDEREDNRAYYREKATRIAAEYARLAATPAEPPIEQEET